jgi:competence protein ComEA
MEHTFRWALPRAAARAIGSRFAKPIARVALVAAALVLLAFVGSTTVTGARTVSKAASAEGLSPTPPSVDGSAAPIAGRTQEPSPLPTTPQPGSGLLPSLQSRVAASPDDPVVLNEATEGDLRRLPGIGAKRADAILALRARLGRFRAVEDLLKVRGIGRATLRRLRPLVRLDPPPSDAGSPPPATSPR